MPTSFLFTGRRRGWLLWGVLLLVDALTAGRATAQLSSHRQNQTFMAAPDSSPAATPAGGPMVKPAAPVSNGDSILLNQAPAFPGGETALLSFIRSHLRYPSLAARNRVEGKVVVSFWINEVGRPYGFGVLKGLGGGLDEEALRILREMPDWTPAVVNGRPTLMQLRIPVVFRLAQ